MDTSHLTFRGSRVPYLAQGMGYTSSGIQKGWYAARGMSLEAKFYGGGVPKMAHGGITASLQSIGATGHIKPAAYNSLSHALEASGMKAAPMRIGETLYLDD